MALRYHHRDGLWSGDALQVAFKPPWEMNAMSRITRLQARAHAGGLGGSLSSNNEPAASGSNAAQALLSDRWKGSSPRNFVAAPNYSSLLRSTRRRHHELRMKTRDRVFLSISDWIFRRMQDPLVEIDPVTVTKAQIVDQKAEAAERSSANAKASENVKADSTVATTSPSYFGYLPPGFPKGANRAALAAAIVLLLVALFTAAILAMRGKKQTSTHLPLEEGSPPQGGSTPAGSGTNGGAREDVESDRSATLQESGDLNNNNTSLNGTESDKAVGRRAQPVVTSSFETQSSTFKPIPRYSTALEQSDLPLPPSLSYSTSTKDKTPPAPSAVDTTEKTGPPRTEEASSTQGDDLTEPSIAPLKDDGDHAGEDQVLRPEADGSRVTNGTITLDTAAVELETAAIAEMASSALHEELTTGAMTDLLDSSPTGQSSTAESSVTEPIVSLPPESEHHENGPPSLPPAAEAPADEAPAAEATIPEAPADEGPADEGPAAEPLAPLSAESPAAEPPAEETPAAEGLVAEAPAVLSEESGEEDYDLTEDSAPAILPPVEALASPSPETEAPAEAPGSEAPAPETLVAEAPAAEPSAQLSEESQEQEYMLIGDSDSLVPVGELSARLARIAALPTAADMGRIGDPASLRPPEEMSTGPQQTVPLPIAADVGGPVESVAVDPPSSTESTSSQEDDLAESSTLSAVDTTDHAESSTPPAVESTDLAESSIPPAVDATKSIDPPLTTEATSSQEDDFAQSSTPPALDTTEKIDPPLTTEASSSQEDDFAQSSTPPALDTTEKTDPPLTTEASSSQEDDLAESSITPPKDDGNGVLRPESITQPPSEERSSELVGVLAAAAQKGVPIGSTQFEKPDSQPRIEAATDAEAIKKSRKEYVQVLEKTFPAVSIGAGVAALSSLSGVNGALEVVGLLAAASLITPFLWAGPREKLMKDIRNIKDHDQLVLFLKDRNIIPEAWN